MPAKYRKSQAGRKRAGRPTAGPCYWCGTHTHPSVMGGKRATWDHIVPQSTNPRQGYTKAGMVRACATCNSTRKDMPAHQWAARIRAIRNPHAPSRDW